jgi:hypothetical protein
VARRRSSGTSTALRRIKVTHLYVAGVGILILALSFPFLRGDRTEERGWEEDSSPDTRVLVLNGCGTEGVAEEVSSCLRDSGFDIVATGNADAFDYERTIVIDRCGSREKAERVGQVLQCQRVMLQRVKAPLSDVTVVVGADWVKLRSLGEWKQRTGWNSRR